MIKLEKTEVMNFKNALRGMRNPMNSWDKSDSGYDLPSIHEMESTYYIGENDLALARKLTRAGSDHRKFLRQIFVSVDITAPLYWWKEYDTYKVGTVANSCSTMHKIHEKKFDFSDFSCEKLVGMEDLNGTCAIKYTYTTGTSPLGVLSETIRMLNLCRDNFLKTKDKIYWWQMIQLLPSSYNQKRTCTLNYEVLLNIYHARKYHKLDEWKELTEWIESLPYFKEICLGGEGNEG